MSAGRSAVVDLCSEGLCCEAAAHSYRALHLGGYRPLLCPAHARELARRARELGPSALRDLDIQPPLPEPS